ncbi:chemotaxis protein CheB [Cryptosporangium japonicum]
MPDETRSPVDVVALVSSAGGLDAVTTILRELPADLPVAIVVQQHLGRQGSSLLRILRRRVGQQLHWATHGGVLRLGQVTVCPPMQRMEIYPDHGYGLFPTPDGARDHPHDALLMSLADSLRSRALAVVLTGMLRDGAAGTAALLAAGGVVIAQSEETAEQPSMPRAAAEAGADLVLPLHGISPVVADVVRGRPLPRRPDETGAISATFGDDGTVAQLARHVDWAGTALGAVRTWPDARRVAVRLAVDSPHAVALYFGDAHLQLFNEATVPSLGGRHAEVFAQPYAASYPQLVDYMLPVLAAVYRGERIYHPAQLVVLERHGRLEDVWFDMSYTPIRDTSGAVIGVYESFHERTDEVLTARRLRTVNRLAGAPVGPSRTAAIRTLVASLAASDDVPFAAAYAVDAGGQRAGLVGVVGADEGGALAPWDVRLVPGTAWPVHEAVRSGGPVDLDDVAARFRGARDGSGPPALERAVLFPLRDEAEDRVVAVLVLGVHPRLPLHEHYREFLELVADTVAAKVAESHARQRERQRLARLAELDRAKTEFFSSVSHEFRTPLTLMLGPLEDLRTRPDDRISDRAADLDLLVRNTQRLLRLVGHLLDFSRAEAGRLRAGFTPVDLSALTGDVVALFRGAADVAGLTLTLDTPPLAEPVWVDPDMWETIVANLLSNALKYTWNGSVTVTLRGLPQHAELVVADTGVGIPSAELPRLFQRFHRVRGAHGRTSDGAGIGLALVHELVRAHGGRVRATSEPDAGTTVTVWVPRGTRARAGDPERAPSGQRRVAATMAAEAEGWDGGSALDPGDDFPAGPGDPPARRAPGARILVVDDDPDMRGYLRRLLGEAWTVVAARNGDEALRAAEKEPPDLVITDVTTSGADGFALLRAVRGHPALESLPVVLVTARAGERAAIDGLLAGADDYVVKPFSARELVARVSAQLDLSRVRRAADERLRQVLEAGVIGSACYDVSTGTLLDANDEFLRMTGYTRADVEERALSWERLAPPGCAGSGDRPWARPSATGRIGPSEREYLDADGARRRMLVAGRDLGDGTVSQFCVEITGNRSVAP